MLPRAVAEDMVGGLAGGEKTWLLVGCGGRDKPAESQDKADGRSIMSRIGIGVR